MEQLFSPGLLYSIAPEDMCELHLQDETMPAEVEWEEDESQLYLLAQSVLSAFVKPAAK
jgi:hypothetical protein